MDNRSSHAVLLIVIALGLMSTLVLDSPRPVWASPRLYEYYNTGDTLAWDPLYGANWASMSFTVGTSSHTITSVKLKLYRVGSPGTATVSIRMASSAPVKPTGSDLTSGMIDGNTLTTATAGQWYEISLTEYTLAASTEYFIVVRVPSGDVNNKLRWIGNTAGGYRGGWGCDSNDSGSTWDITLWDVMFEVWGNLAASTAGDVANHVLAGGPTLKYLYPAYAAIGGTKLSGVLYADPADVYAATGALEGRGGIGYAQGYDTDSSKVSAANGMPLTTWAPSGSYIVMTSGPLVHNSIHYYMDLATSMSGDQSPAYWSPSTPEHFQFVQRAGSMLLADVLASDVMTLHRDVAMIQSFTDGNGRAVFIITGITLKGTQAGALWFAHVVMTNPAAFTNQVYIISWNDASTPWVLATPSVTLAAGNNDGFVDFAEIQQIATV